MKRKKVQKTGNARMRELGKRQVTLWLDPQDYVLLSEQAEENALKLPAWILHIARKVALGERILR